MLGGSTGPRLIFAMLTSVARSRFVSGLPRAILVCAPRNDEPRGLSRPDNQAAGLLERYMEWWSCSIGYISLFIQR